MSIFPIQTASAESFYKGLTNFVKAPPFDQWTCLDSGTSAIVYLSPNQRHVIRVLNNRKTYSENHIIQKANKEAELLAISNQIRHTVRTLAVFVCPQDRLIACIQEYHGQTLHDRFIKREASPPSMETLESIFKQTLQALSDMHEKKALIHTDIKTNNITIEQNGRVTVIDVTDALRVENGKAHSGFSHRYPCYAEAYRPPELIGKKEQKHLYSGSDSWALACTIFEIATKRRLFLEPAAGESEKTWMSRLRKNWLERSGHSPKPYQYGGPIQKVLSDIYGDTEKTRQLSNLLVSMIDFYAGFRPTAQEALNHPFFYIRPSDRLLSSCYGTRTYCPCKTFHL